MAAQAAEGDVEPEDEGLEIVNLEDIPPQMPLREWINMEDPRDEIKRRFKVRGGAGPLLCLSP